jgi:hypothetical protein
MGESGCEAAVWYWIGRVLTQGFLPCNDGLVKATKLNKGKSHPGKHGSQHLRHDASGFFFSGLYSKPSDRPAKVWPRHSDWSSAPWNLTLDLQLRQFWPGECHMENGFRSYAIDPQFERKEAVRLMRLALSLDDGDPDTFGKCCLDLRIIDRRL